MTQKFPVSTTAYIVLRGAQVMLCAALEYTSGTLAFYFDGGIGYRRLRRRASPARASSSSTYSSSLSDASSVWSAATDPRATQIVLFTVGAISALTAVASLGMHFYHRGGNRGSGGGSSTGTMMKFVHWWDALLAVVWLVGVAVLANSMAVYGVFGKHRLAAAYCKATLGLASVIMVAFFVSAAYAYRLRKAEQSAAPGSVAGYVPVPGSGRWRQQQDRNLPPPAPYQP